MSTSVKSIVGARAALENLIDDLIALLDNDAYLHRTD
jgi:hypothetical protein